MVSSNPPPASNTGVENKIVAQSIDWIEGTYHNRYCNTLPRELTKEYEPCHPLNGYTVGHRFSDGRIELTSPARPDMGRHIIWSGDALKAIPLPVSDLVRFLYSSDFIFTRIDFAIDAYNFGVKPSDATEEIKNDRFVSRARKFPAWHDAKLRGYTQYIGTKASEIYLRIYDKAAELGLEQDHARIELVVRKSRAQKAVPTIVRDGNFRALVLGFIRFSEWKEWQEVMATNAVTLPADKKSSNTEQWLLTQCAPALARLMVESGSHDIWFRFKDEVAKQVAEIESRKRQTAN